MVRQRRGYTRLHGGRLRSNVPFRRAFSMTSLTSNSPRNHHSQNGHSTTEHSSVNSTNGFRPPFSRSQSVSQNLSTSANLVSNSSTPKLQSNHESFIQAFQVPTTLYRFLAQRHLSRPIMLQRSLRYMNTVNNTNTKTKRNKSLSDIVGRLSNLRRMSTIACCPSSGTSRSTTDDLLRISSIKFVDSESENEWTTTKATLSICVVHYWTNTRKGLRGHKTFPLVNNHVLCVNSSPDNSPTGRKRPKLSPNCGQHDSSGNTTGQVIQLHWEDMMESSVPGKIQHSTLLFKVHSMEKRASPKASELLSSTDPRRPARSYRCPASSRKFDGFPVFYRASLPLLTRGSSTGVGAVINDYQVQLFTGEYEIRLDVDWKSNGSETQNHHHLEWTPAWLPKDEDSYTEYNRWPLLRFLVDWSVSTSSPLSQEPCTPKADTPVRSSTTRNRRADRTPPHTNGFSGNELSPQQPRSTANGGRSLAQNNTPKLPPTIKPSPLTTTIYRFIFAGQLHQWTESRDLVCPWCRLISPNQTSLLAHLRNWHLRFRFKASRPPLATSSASSHHVLSLEVTISDTFDGSNDCCGLSRKRESSLIPSGDDALLCGLPERRLSFTKLIYWNGNRSNDRLNGDHLPAQRSLGVGHNRTYMHTTTALAVHPKDFEVDTESRQNTTWICQHYERKIEDFSDVNQGEKRTMQLWNQHLLKQDFLGDCQINLAVESFIREYGATFRQLGLRGNLLFHLTNLADYGILSTEVIERVMIEFDALDLSPKKEKVAHFD